MADTALNVQTDSGKAERKCAWCGADISHRNSRARYCGQTCKDRRKSFDWSLDRGYWPREMQGPRIPVECPECGKQVEQSNGGRTYCERDGPCSRRATRRRGVDRGYFEQPLVKLRMRNAVRRYYHQGNGSEYMAQWRHDNRDHVNAQAREYRRNRAAQAAISLLIMPIGRGETMNEPKREWPEQQQEPLEQRD